MLLCSYFFESLAHSQLPSNKQLFSLEGWGLGFGWSGLGGLGFGVWGLGFGVWGLGFGVCASWSVVDCKQVRSWDSWNTSAWQRQQAPSAVLSLARESPRTRTTSRQSSQKKQIFGRAATRLTKSGPVELKTQKLEYSSSESH